MHPRSPYESLRFNPIRPFRECVYFGQMIEHVGYFLRNDGTIRVRREGEPDKVITPCVKLDMFDFELLKVIAQQDFIAHKGYPARTIKL